MRVSNSSVHDARNDGPSGSEAGSDLPAQDCPDKPSARAQENPKVENRPQRKDIQSSASFRADSFNLALQDFHEARNKIKVLNEKIQNAPQQEIKGLEASRHQHYQVMGKLYVQLMKIYDDQVNEQVRSEEQAKKTELPLRAKL